jgi:hypothetical protein
MTIEEDYIILIDLLIKLVESQAGKEIPPGNEWINDAQTLSRKLFQHLTTIQSISAGTKIPIDKDNYFAFIDHSSAVVITRTALETFLIFHHLYGESDKELSKFKHKLWKLSGLLSRQDYPMLIEENQKKLEFEREEIESLKAEIQSSLLFAKYSQKQQKQILKGNWDFNTSWQDMAVKAGFHPVHFRMTYSFLCGYSHAGYISVLQIGQAKTIEEQHDLTLPMLQIGGVIMAFFTFNYCGLFSSAGEVLESNAEAKVIAESWHLT